MARVHSLNRSISQGPPELSMQKLFTAALRFAPALLTASAFGQTALHVLSGDNAGDRYGQAVAGLGDVDGDLVADWAVSSPFEDATGSMAGSVRVYSGASAALLYIFDGSSAGDLFGYSIAGGDVNGDGRADIIVGAYGDDPNGIDSGSVSVYSGLDGTLLHFLPGNRPGDNFGIAVAFVPDTSGDAKGEILVGAWAANRGAQNNGAATLYSGADASQLQLWSGENAYDFFGGALAGLDDVDGDGLGDVLIGSYRNDVAASGAGSAYAYSGASGALLYTFRGASTGDSLGFTVADAGDVNADGRSDLLIGAPGSDTAANNAGQAQVFSGIDGALIYTLLGDSAGDNFGAALVGDLDLDADGSDDFAIGTPASDFAGDSAGRVRLYNGLDASILATLDGSESGARFGASLADGGDVNANGDSELLIGAWGEDGGLGAFTGTMHVYTMDTALPLVSNYCTSLPNSLGLTAAISNTGSTSVIADDLVLVADDLIPSSSGLFFFGNLQIQAPFGDGYRCVGGSVKRYAPISSDAFGSVTMPANLTSGPGGPGLITPGSTWNYQFWYRDAASPGVGFNLTDGLRVTFVN